MTSFTARGALDGSRHGFTAHFLRELQNDNCPDWGISKRRPVSMCFMLPYPSAHGTPYLLARRLGDRGLKGRSSTRAVSRGDLKLKLRNELVVCLALTPVDSMATWRVKNIPMKDRKPEGAEHEYERSL